MAKRENETSKLELKLISETLEDGTKKYVRRSYQHINPAATDDDILALGNGLASLQTYELDSVTRTTSAGLTAAA